MNSYLIIFLIILNLILFYSLFRKKIRRIFSFAKVKSVDLSSVHEVFLPNSNIKEYNFPKEDVVINNFFIDPSFKLVGLTSDYESWILSCIAKYSKNI
ncbi:MAG: hypothetical protein EBV81_03065, partial [Proteobacteria bacterium]|nr:hypothetical protein [Candidatus Fonsibacter sp. PEL5]